MFRTVNKLYRIGMIKPKWLPPSFESCLSAGERQICRCTSFHKGGNCLIPFIRGASKMTTQGNSSFSLQFSNLNDAQDSATSLTSSPFWNWFCIIPLRKWRHRHTFCWGKREFSVSLWLWNSQILYSLCFSKKLQVHGGAGMGRINSGSKEKCRRKKERVLGDNRKQQ